MIVTLNSVLLQARECRRVLLTILFVLVCATDFAQAQQGISGIANALRETLTQERSSKGSGAASNPLFDFYASRNFAPAWTGSDASLSNAAIVLSALRHADAQGLRVRDYAGTASRWRAVPDGGPDATAFELSLTADLMRYAADVRLGRLNEKAVYNDVDFPPRTFEFVGALNAALRAGKIERFLADLPPPQPQYQGLVQALAQYRVQQGRGGWEAKRPLRG
jgi:murein L,D-transpeptidase YcbB/YkuD